MIVIPGTIPITIHPFFWVVVLLISSQAATSITSGILWAFVIFWSVLIHEYGHALTARFFGQTAKIDLIVTGGLTQRKGPTLKLWQEFLVILNGPLAGICLYLMAAFILRNFHIPRSTLLGEGLSIAISINLLWTLLNLIPVQPMDGGRLLTILMEMLFGTRGIKIALFISLCLALFCALISIYLGWLFLSAIFFIFMYESYRLWKDSLGVTDQDKRKDVQLMLKAATHELVAGNMTEAYTMFDQIRQMTGSGLIYVAANEAIAKILDKQGRKEEARDTLLSIESNLKSDALALLQKLLYETGDYRKGAEVGKKAFQYHPTYKIAWINACCHSRLKEITPAIKWLEASIREGLPDFGEQWLQRADFDPIRNTDQFKEFESKL